MLKNKFPKDFAQIVCTQLKRKTVSCPKIDILTDLFELMFFASLQTEEQQSINFHIVYLDPDNPDPKPPRRIVKNRWSFVKFTKNIPLTISNAIKIAKASDPRTSSLAIFVDKGELFIWGLIDQGNQYHDYLNYDSEEGPERPGVFQASIVGFGNLVAYRGYWKIAELKLNKVTNGSVDVFNGGPVYKTLIKGINNYIETIKREVPENIYENRTHWNDSLKSYWISSLCRVLLRIQNYKHGGAILITPSESYKGLNIKYEINYSRLKTALKTKALEQIENTRSSDIIFEKYLDKNKPNMPVILHLDESVSRNELVDNFSEIDSTIWFISLLSRVDGLVLMNSDLEVKGFGVEITTSKKPIDVFISSSVNATPKSLSKMDYEHFGTRHRSMMRYCSNFDGSIGFVISQDGDIRAMTKVNDQLVIWENIKLQQFSEEISHKNTDYKNY